MPVRRIAPAFLLLLAATVPVSAPRAQAAPPACSAVADPAYTGHCRVAAAVYRFTIRNMRLRATDGSFVTLGSGDRSFDVAQVGAGQAVGDYASDAPIPAGTYDAIVPTLGPVWTVRGSYRKAVDGGVLGDCVTTAAGASDDPADEGELAFDLAAFIQSDPDHAPPDMQVVDGDLVITDTSAAGLPLTVGDGDVVDFTISFDAGSGVEFEYVGGSCVGASLGELFVDLSFTKS